MSNFQSPTSNLLLQLLLGLILSTAIGYIGYRRATLTRSGWLGAVITGTTIFGFGGLDLALLLIVFFVSSSLLTHLNTSAKIEVAVMFAKSGRRDLGQTLANGGIASIAAIYFGLTQNPIGLAAFIGAMAEATADTWSTELGVLAKRWPRSIVSGREVAPGTSGGVTLPGTLAAAIGALLIALLAALFRSTWQLLPIGLAAGLIGALVDSLLGATVQGIYFSKMRRQETERSSEPDGSPNRLVRGVKWINNEVVNFASTLVAALVAALLLSVLSHSTVVPAVSNSNFSPVAPTRMPSSSPSPLPRVTPATADRFDFPLDPNRFGPYVYNVTGPLNFDTRYGVQNPGLGRAGKCFVDQNGQRVPFDQLYHAGEDWFAYDGRHQVDPGAAKGALVLAVANGVVSWRQNVGSEGNVVVIEHLLADGSHVWSAYWHIDAVKVAMGQLVYQGNVIGQITDQGDNSHLHWEIRSFGDGSNLFPPTSAGGRGTCDGYVMALGYTWDDVLSRANPKVWGYFDPTKFVKEHR